MHREQATDEDVTGDYQALLADGWVVRRHENALGWIARMHAQARQDALLVESTISPVEPDLVWMVLRRSARGDLRYEAARLEVVREIAELAARGADPRF